MKLKKNKLEESDCIRIQNKIPKAFKTIKYKKKICKSQGILLSHWTGLTILLLPVTG